MLKEPSITDKEREDILKFVATEVTEVIIVLFVKLRKNETKINSF